MSDSLTPLYSSLTAKHLSSWGGHTFTQHVHPQVTASVLSEHDYQLMLPLFRNKPSYYLSAGLVAAVIPGLEYYALSLFLPKRYVRLITLVAAIMVAPTVPVAVRARESMDHLAASAKYIDPRGVSIAMRNAAAELQRTKPFNSRASMFQDLWFVRIGSKGAIQKLVEHEGGWKAVGPPLAVAQSIPGEQDAVENEFHTTSLSLAQDDEAPIISPAAPEPKSRWDDIRQKTVSQGKPSSWDSIRQSHERQRLDPTKQMASSDSTSDLNQWEDRNVAQAKFDAMLEQERRQSR